MNNCPATESRTINKGELEECRDMVNQLIEKVLDLSVPDRADRAETTVEAVHMLRYIRMQLEDGLKPDGQAAE